MYTWEIESCVLFFLQHKSRQPGEGRSRGNQQQQTHWGPSEENSVQSQACQWYVQMIIQWSPSDKDTHSAKKICPY